MNARRKICVVTGARADYGLLYWLLRGIDQDPDLTLQLAVTGMHLSPRFGMTVDVIEKDGFQVAARVDCLSDDDDVVAVSRSVAKGVAGFADAFAMLAPDLVVMLGDRFEIMAAAQAALIANIPLAHIHGGEVTLGAFDDSIRHAITKMSHVHFVAAEPYRKRVIQMGEQPRNVHLVGAPGLDYIKQMRFVEREALEAFLEMNLAAPLLLATYHPVTRDGQSSIEGIQALLEALKSHRDARIIFTGVNADPGFKAVDQRIRAFAEANAERVRVVASLGQDRYLSAMRYADAVIGNSSSGIIEAPFLKTPSINIGTRQLGRIRANSVIDCTENAHEIAAAITKALTGEFRCAVADMDSPFGDGTASSRMLAILKSVDLTDICEKPFYDVEFSR